MKDMPAGVHAKTGTMNGVRTLAGFVHRNGQAKYAFAVLYNGYKGSSAPYKESQERFCRILAGATRR
jgi:D-alanyl-D-alanine carboxypeptidase